MATKKDKTKKSDGKKNIAAQNLKEKSTLQNSIIMAVTIIIVFVAALLISIYLLSSNAPKNATTFASFQRSFYSAPRVAIYVNDMNQSTYQYTLGCATSLIESIVANKNEHRNSSTIDFYVINNTLCVAPNGALGKSNGTINMSASKCLSSINNQPSIFINYSATNKTTISGTTLYTSGDYNFLRECGIASELG